MFNEHDSMALLIIKRYERFLVLLELEFHISYKDLRRDAAREFLNKIEEFKALEE